MLLKRNPHTDSFFYCKQKRYFESLSFLNRISSQTFAMKHFLFLLSILAGTLSYAQESIHFLFTTEGNYQISEPLCEDMIKEAEEMMNDQMKKIKEAKKSGFLDLKNAQLQDQVNFMLLERIAENPKDYFVPYYPIIFLLDAYSDAYGKNLFASLQEVGIKELVPPSIQINFRNVVVSPSQTSLDIDLIDLGQPNNPIRSNHFFCPTGRLLQEVKRGQWFYFWKTFFDQTKMPEWLVDQLYIMNSKLISKNQFNALITNKLEELGMNSSTYIQERVDLLKQKLSGFPTDIFKFEETQGILMSSDQRKFALYTLTKDPELIYEVLRTDTSEYYESAAWLFQIMENGEIQYGRNDGNYLTKDIIQSSLNKFYSYAFSPAPEVAYNEARWLAELFDEKGVFNTLEILVLKHESQSEESSELIRSYISPQLTKITLEEAGQYSGFYQRMTPFDLYGYYYEASMEEQVYKDYLLSNVEKTAFIYPILLQNRLEQDREYYYTQEDFKFFVLLKNEQGTFDLYDWHYFSVLPYKDYYSLLTCAYSHLNKICNWDAESAVIDDEAFWNNYIFKKSERGFDHLSKMTSKLQSPTINKSEFEAQVADSYQLLLEQDVAELYPNQLKQIMLCLNTIQTFNLTGKNETELYNLATQLHFEKRLQKGQKSSGPYYPKLNLEFGKSIEPHSYYLIK